MTRLLHRALVTAIFNGILGRSSDRCLPLQIKEKQLAYIVQFDKVAQEVKPELLDRQKEIIGLQS